VSVPTTEPVFRTKRPRYIFQDLVTAGDLLSYLETKNGRLIENEAAHIVRQIVIAVKFLHERSIVHRNIKPENILMTTLAVGCRVILTDFGGARRIANHRQRMTSVEGTLRYHAPYVFIRYACLC
jgi:serine/threonine protein kinase